jgi:hypothetical protein
VSLVEICPACINHSFFVRLSAFLPLSPHLQLINWSSALFFVSLNLAIPVYLYWVQSAQIEKVGRADCDCCCDSPLQGARFVTTTADAPCTMAINYMASLSLQESEALASGELVLDQSQGLDSSGTSYSGWGQEPGGPAAAAAAAAVAKATGHWHGHTDTLRASLIQSSSSSGGDGGGFYSDSEATGGAGLAGAGDASESALTPLTAELAATGGGIVHVLPPSLTARFPRLETRLIITLVLAAAVLAAASFAVQAASAAVPN